ncbi:MAG: biopolymer transporter ExbD [Candidatus Melainabacteria bacterium]|nr:biopolymer transporter ExbD [Candidatus Melainabacteria bacterium]
MAGGSSQSRVFDEINITPLTDIFLVLLIIMMVVAPMMQSMRSDIQMPEMASGQHVDPGRLIVEVVSDGTFYVDSQPIQDSNLMPLMKERLGSLEEKSVVIRADKATRSGAVMKIFQAAREAGYEKVTIAGQPQAAVAEAAAAAANPASGTSHLSLPSEETTEGNP